MTLEAAELNCPSAARTTEDRDRATARHGAVAQRQPVEEQPVEEGQKMSLAVMTDELADVQLEGIPLVSDNPSDWIIPESMHQHSTVIEWWQNLINSDTAEKKRLDAEKRAAMLEIVYEYQNIKNIPTGIGKDYFPIKRRIRTLIRELLKEELTLNQVALILGDTEHNLMRNLHVNKNITTDDIERKMQIVECLRKGMDTIDIIKQCGSDASEIRHIAKAFYLETTAMAGERINATLGTPPRELALYLRDCGFTNQATADILNDIGAKNDNGKPFNALLISKWVSRDRKKHKGEH